MCRVHSFNTQGLKRLIVTHLIEISRAVKVVSHLIHWELLQSGKVQCIFGRVSIVLRQKCEGVL